MNLFYPAYFASIRQYVEILKDSACRFEVWDNFERQTYRNRMYILGPNGKQMLNIPVVKQGRIKTREVLIDYKYDWIDLHQKSLDTAYRSSPFYEFYREDILSVLNQKFEKLQDLQFAAHNWVMEALDEESNYTKTSEFTMEVSGKDYRELIKAKKETIPDYPAYYQVFANRFGFTPNLSILDLLFNEGPSSARYLYGLHDYTL